MKSNTRTVLILGVIGVAVALGLAVYQDPYRFFGPSSSTTCADFKTMDAKYQVAFPDRCGCLNERQQELAGQVVVRTLVNACFEVRLRTCKGSEPVGELYASCFGPLGQ